MSRRDVNEFLKVIFILLLFMISTILLYELVFDSLAWYVGAPLSAILILVSFFISSLSINFVSYLANAVKHKKEKEKEKGNWKRIRV